MTIYSRKRRKERFFSPKIMRMHSIFRVTDISFVDGADAPVRGGYTDGGKKKKKKEESDN